MYAFGTLAIPDRTTVISWLYCFGQPYHPIKATATESKDTYCLGSARVPLHLQRIQEKKTSALTNLVINELYHRQKSFRRVSS